MSTATVTSDYKITPPKEIRDSMHLQPGQEFELIQNGSSIQMIPKLTVERLKAAIEEGLASGAGIPADEVFDRLEDKFRKLATGMPNKIWKASATTSHSTILTAL